MTKQELIALGVAEETADKVVKALESYAPKTKLEEVENARKALETQLADRDKQLEELKKTDPAKLQDEIKRLQGENATALATHQTELTALQKRGALAMALRDTAHDPKDIIALLDLEKVELDAQGGLKTKLDDLVKPIQESKPYLFRPADKQPELRGVIPAQPGTIPGPTDGLEAQVYKGLGIEPPKK